MQNRERKKKLITPRVVNVIDIYTFSTPGRRKITQQRVAPDRSIVDGNVNDRWKSNRLSARRIARMIIPCNTDMVIPLIKRRRDAAAYIHSHFSPAVIVRDSAATHLARIYGRIHKEARW